MSSPRRQSPRWHIPCLRPELSIGLDRSSDLALVLTDPQRLADLRADDIPTLLGALEEVRAALWARMVRPPAPVTRDVDGAAGEQLLTVAEAAAELRFTPGYVYDAIRRGQLSAVRKGKYVRIRRAELRAWLDGISSRGLDARPGHPDSRSLHGPRIDRSPPVSSPSSRASRASRGRGARPLESNNPAAKPDPR